MKALVFVLGLVGETQAQTVTKAPPQEPPQAEYKGNVVEVWGPRAEITRPQRAGQSVIIRPEDETRFDTREQLRSEANLTLPDTGRINASGFSLPRVRGQDSRFTEVYLDGLKLQDPYLASPVIDDLDLRACGELAIYVGNPPPSLPTISPNGAIAYRLYMPLGRVSQFGLTVGQPYGTAVWALNSYQSEDGSSVRLYARDHWSRGQFLYYDDNATPYNTADDKISEMRHNDRHGVQFLPSFTWQHDGHRISGIGLWDQSSTSLSARNSSLVSDAHDNSQQRVGRLSYNYRPESGNALWPSVAGMEVARYDDQTTVTDPSGKVLGAAQTNRRILAANNVAGILKWTYAGAAGESAFFLRPEISNTQIHADSGDAIDFNLRRRQESAYVGFDLALPFRTRAEIKASITQLSDGAIGQKKMYSLQDPSPSRNLVLPGTSLGVSWQPGPLILYTQVASVKRAPTLLEQFGDGGLIRESLGLLPETTLHREVGWNWRIREQAAGVSLIKQWTLRSAIFLDHTRDRIVLLQSLAQTLKAQNAATTDITGVEIAGDIAMWDTSITLGYAHLDALDHSFASRVRIIPGVAEHVATANLSQIISIATLRWSSRYQSQVWRDSENSIAVPGYLIHDVTIDAKWDKLSFGLGLYNVTDQRRLSIYASDTAANTGATSYSDYAGMPLPGRNWRVSVSASL